MSRPAIATLLGLSGFLLYVAAVLVLADHVRGVHWTVEFVFFALAGVAWVWPARRLIIWAVRPRGAPRTTSARETEKAP